MKVAFLGPKATFTDLAVQKIFPDATAIPYMTIPDSLDAVMGDEVDTAVVPLENALEGSVNITLDYLVHEVELPIVGEITAPIRQHLLISPKFSGNWQEIEIIYSHSHAIAQCHKFLHSHFKGIPYESVTSTAAAAKYLSEHPNGKVAVIANELAAKEYGLVIAKPDIHDYDFNHTKFIILSKQNLDFSKQQRYKNGDKTTVMVTLPSDQAGTLHQVLSAFAWRKLNLSKIESRPMKTGLGNYFFIIDIEMALDEVLIPGAISELEALGCSVKILGSYPYFQLDKEKATPMEASEV
ncbi:prephenate dehydratase [Cytobacillus sp. Hz8]|uniref:prephenate dehydratase n=1 Tax=Cytobacillus sp. Hz8 TaxID=3347168 RepID=UPI0035DB8ED6